MDQTIGLTVPMNRNIADRQREATLAAAHTMTENEPYEINWDFVAVTNDIPNPWEN